MSQRSTAAIALRDVAAGYGDRDVLHGIDLAAHSGECLVLLGPSGSGKSTVVRVLAGLLTPRAGSVLLQGADVTTRPAHDRDVAVMYRNYGFYAQMTVADNVAHALRARSLDRSEVDSQLQELLALVGLEDDARSEVVRLSAGEQQRANLARVLAEGRRVLLLHEPLSCCDEDLRSDVGERLRAFQGAHGTTVVLTTRDQREAFRMADRVAVLHNGRVEQEGTPRQLYTDPNSVFVARLLGEVNVVSGEVADGPAEAGLLTVATPLGQLRGVGAATAGERVQVLVRPETFSFESSGGLRGTARRTRYFGSHSITTVDIGGESVSVRSCGASAKPPLPGETASLTVNDTECRVLRSRSPL